MTRVAEELVLPGDLDVAQIRIARTGGSERARDRIANRREPFDLIERGVREVLAVLLGREQRHVFEGRAQNPGRTRTTGDGGRARILP